MTEVGPTPRGCDVCGREYANVIEMCDGVWRCLVDAQRWLDRWSRRGLPLPGPHYTGLVPEPLAYMLMGNGWRSEQEAS